MTKEEAIEALKNGKALAHPLLMGGEYITMQGKSILIQQNGGNKDDDIYLHIHDFWKDKTDKAWETYWEIF